MGANNWGFEPWKMEMEELLLRGILGSPTSQGVLVTMVVRESLQQQRRISYLNYQWREAGVTFRQSQPSQGKHEVNAVIDLGIFLLLALGSLISWSVLTHCGFYLLARFTKILYQWRLQSKWLTLPGWVVSASTAFLLFKIQNKTEHSLSF